MTRHFLNAQQRAIAARVFDSPGKRFSDLVKTASLDPAQDLRGKALHRIVLQPDEDLTGYDFTGADISGAVFRRVDLSRSVLTGALMIETDLRGAKLPEGFDAHSVQGIPLSGDLPPALRFGPNRLWPWHLTAEINQFLSQNTDEVALFIAAQKRLQAEETVLAEQLFRALLDWRLVLLEEDHANTLTTQHELARAVLNQGRASEAEEMLRALLPIRQKVSGKDHAHTLTTQHELARAVLDQGRASEAEEMLRALLPIRQKVSVKDHANTLTTQHELARAVLDQGRASEAEEILRALLPIRKKVSGEDHAHTFFSQRVLARTLLEQSRTQEAADLLADLPPDGGDPAPRHVGQVHLVRAFLADLQGDAATADSYLNKAEDALVRLDNSHYARRMLARYRKTRTPGAAGGTVLWIAADQPLT